MGRILLMVKVVALAGVVFWLAACSRPETSSDISSELEEFVAQAIIDAQLSLAEGHPLRSPEKSVVAHVVATETYGEPYSPLWVWRYSQGQLADENSDILSKAFGDDSSGWPPYTFIFAFESTSSKQATVDVHTFYNRGATGVGRGGVAEKWELEKRSGVWTVTRKTEYRLWD